MIAHFRENADSLLTALGDKLGLENCQFDEENETCPLLIDKKTIRITANGALEQILLHTELGTLPDQGRCDLVEQLLEANLFWAGTRGATLSIERQSSLVLLAQATTLFKADGTPLSVNEMQTMLFDFVNVAAYWRKLLHPETAASPIDITKMD